MAWALVGCAGLGGSGESSDDGAGSTSEAQTGDTASGTSEGGSEAGSSGESTAPPTACSEDALSEMYVRYVEPFVSGAVPTSCSQCHMTGIDMSLYAQDTPCATMACMVEMGAVDLDDPQGSTLLSQIMLGDPQSSVFDVSEEHAAMLEWIEWSAQCHGEVCGDLETPACTSGTGASSTGVNPIGDCSEDDLLVEFWNSVIVDRGRCLTCHSDYGQELGTFGACQSNADCMEPQICGEGLCRAPGPWQAPHMFEGVDGPLDWENPAHRQLGLNTMYNMVALGQIDEDDPLESALLVKPLLEGFSPTAIHGDGVSVPSVPPQTGTGVYHGGTSKFNFGFHGAEGEPPPPTSGVVDCRTDEPCGDGPCSEGRVCTEGLCRAPGSYCDQTYANYVRFVEYFASCKGQ
ncbi:MAG: hypothetical protein KDK70_32225 [Myxococcales bacterium]|nr:hypothetical protein [Myxococcales bacterium]